MNTISFAIDPAARDALMDAGTHGYTVEIEVRTSGCYVVVTQRAEHQPHSVRQEATDTSVELVAA